MIEQAHHPERLHIVIYDQIDLENMWDNKLLRDVYKIIVEL